MHDDTAQHDHVGDVPLIAGEDDVPFEVERADESPQLYFVFAIGRRRRADQEAPR
jgi:hypothetical protein